MDFVSGRPHCRGQAFMASPLCAGSVKIFDEFRHRRIENFYPLTPPWMTPFSILSWKKGKAMMMGAMAAMITANWIR